MPMFDYKAVSPDGALHEGRMDSLSRDAVIAKIQLSGQIPISADGVSDVSRAFKAAYKKEGNSKKISQIHIYRFTQALASLIQSGVALDRALEILISVEENSSIKAMAQDIQKSVREGKSLSKALEAQGGAFTKFYISMIKTAEASGNMADCLSRLSDYMKNSKALKDKVVSALVYPVILTVVAGISLLIIMTYVVPQFAPLFEDMGDALPTSTRIILSLSETVQEYSVYGVVVLLLAIIAMKIELTSPKNRKKYDRLVLTIPLLGDLIRKIEMARFSRSLGTLLNGGVPLLNGLSIAREVVGNGCMQQDLQLAIDRLKEGSLISDSLLSSPHFPRLAVQMMKVGEESGNMDSMLLEIADSYDGEVSMQMQRLLMVLEPLLIITLGIAIAGIIISVLVGIVSINDLPM